jgi:hypothetical protein
MPLTIKRTNSTSIAANSVLFNGSNQYLTATRSSGWLTYANNFTLECWVYFTRNPTVSYGGIYHTCIAGTYTTSLSVGWELLLYGSNGADATTGIGFGAGSGNNVSASITLNKNTWYHIALVKNSTTMSIYVNGVVAGTGVVSSWSDRTLINIGRSGYSPYLYYFPGYISNFRIVDGTAVYTSNFTPSATPLTAIANTALLTCKSATIVDNSTNNFAITNNNAATVSSINPFRAPINNFQFARRASTAVGRSVLFNGTNQYLSVASNAAFGFGASDYTIEFWTYYPPTSTIYGKTVIDSRPTATNGNYWIFATSSTGIMSFYTGADGTTITDTVARTNQWVHYAVSRLGSSLKLFANGTQVASTTDSSTTLASGLLIGANAFRGTAPDTYWSGYISNIRILKGTALYTSNFTAPTSPLTAIANTSLLACNADTIVDSSTNNFTITNNNGATVSSISPFVASSGGMSLKKVFADAIVFVAGTQKAIFGYGWNGTTYYSMTNLVINTGVVATDTTGVGTARRGLAAAGYGSDKAIFGYGATTVSNALSMTNLVSSAGVVATDTTGVGTGKYLPAAAGYGTDKAIFGYGSNNGSTYYSITNLVSNTGVVANDTAGVGTAREATGAVSYGNDKAIFGYGLVYGVGNTAVTNKVSNTGVVATDTTGVGTARRSLAAASYGTDKAIFGYGYISSMPGVSMTNLVSNTGVVATDTVGVGTARNQLAAAGYGGDKAIFGYGYNVSITNLVSNTGVVATDTVGVGTARYGLAAAGYSLT